jgi:hypothetical protein
MALLNQALLTQPYASSPDMKVVLFAWLNLQCMALASCIDTAQSDFANLNSLMLQIQTRRLSCLLGSELQFDLVTA